MRAYLFVRPYAAAAPLSAAAARAGHISTHHQRCAQCASARQRGRATGRLVFGRGGLERQPCARERLLFADLATLQDEGWPHAQP